MNPVPREIEYDYDQMTQDFKSAKKEAPIKPIKVAEGVYKKPVGKTSRRQMFVRNTSAPVASKPVSAPISAPISAPNSAGVFNKAKANRSQTSIALPFFL